MRHEFGVLVWKPAVFVWKEVANGPTIYGLILILLTITVFSACQVYVSGYWVSFVTSVDHGAEVSYSKLICKHAKWYITGYVAEYCFSDFGDTVVFHNLYDTVFGFHAMTSNITKYWIYSFLDYWLVF